MINLNLFRTSKEYKYLGTIFDTTLKGYDMDLFIIVILMFTYNVKKTSICGKIIVFNPHSEPLL